MMDQLFIYLLTYKMKAFLSRKKIVLRSTELILESLQIQWKSLQKKGIKKTGIASKHRLSIILPQLASDCSIDRNCEN